MASPNNYISKFLTAYTVPASHVDHFSTSSWLAPYVKNPRYKLIPTFSRILKPSGEDFFFSETINTPSTLPRLVCLQLKDLKPPPLTSPRPTKAPAAASKSSSVQVPSNPDVYFLATLGKRGLDGHPATLHGGVICAILDETMGMLVMLHSTEPAEPRASLFTVNLNVTYRAPVMTPNDMLVRCWVTGRQGRKWWSHAQLVNEEGIVMAEAEGLWVEARRKEQKL